MGRSQETFGKKEREKKRAKKRLDKQKKKEERQSSNEKGSGPSIAYVDEWGNVTETPPDPAEREEVNAEDIVLGVPKKEHDPNEGIYRGRVEFFDDSKGYGFIKETGSGDKYFVHISGVLEDEIRENDNVVFELEQGLKGLNAVKVKKT